ncbi:nicotinate-nucleotide--dimethylbenzimidazole phosphoribosyltransferase, partial [Thermosipho melanesiensis]
MIEFGILYDLALKISKIQRRKIPKLFKDKRVYVFAGDHGVVEENVSAYPKEVTYQMVKNYFNGGAGINVFARHIGVKFFVVDAGVDYDFEDHSFLIKKKMGYGTKNFSKGPAMTKDEALLSINYGRQIANDAIESGADLLAIGDMRIGNTTTATAMAAAFGYNIDDILDIGTPIDNERLKNKKKAVERAIEINKP